MSPHTALALAKLHHQKHWDAQESPVLFSALINKSPLYSAFREYSDPLYFFHILLSCSPMLSHQSSSYHQSTLNTPQWQSKNRIRLFSANSLKRKNCNQLTYVFRPFTQYLVEAPLAAIIALSLFGYDATSLAHLDLGIFCYFSLQILSCWLDGNLQWKGSLEMSDWVYKSGLWLGHSRTFTEFSLSPSWLVLAVYLGSLSC